MFLILSKTVKLRVPIIIGLTAHISCFFFIFRIYVRIYNKNNHETIIVGDGERDEKTYIKMPTLCKYITRTTTTR